MNNNAEEQERKPNIIDRALNANRKVDAYWRKGVLWFWGFLLLFIVLYICNILFSAIGL